MKKHRFLYQVFGVLCLFLLFACVAGQESFDMGEALSAKQRWEEAIVFYEKALKENPGEEKFRLALEKAKQAAAKDHYAKTKDMLSAYREPDLLALDRILKEAETAYNFDPKNPEIASLKRNVSQKRQTLIKEIETLYASSDEAMRSNDWVKATKNLRTITKIYPGYEDTADKLALAEKEGAKYYYKQGLAFGKDEEWHMAVQAFKMAIDINAAYHDVQTLYKKAKANDNIAYHIRKGEQASKARQWEKAIDFYNKALDYEPDNETVYKALETVKSNASQDCLNQAIDLTFKNKLNGAVSEFKKALSYDPSLKRSPFFREALEKMNRKLLQRSENYAAREKWGNALVWLKKIESLTPNYENLFYKVQAADDAIKKRIKRSIAVFDFSHPSNDPDAGKIVANKLITFLYEKASGDLRIIERENLQSILKELQLGQTGLVDLETAQRVGKMRGIDTFILGDVLHFSSAAKDFPSTKTVMLKVGSKRIKTRAFLEWEAKHPDPSRKELETAPEAYEEQDIYERFSYKAGVTKIRAFIEVSYKMVDTLTGETLFTDTSAGKLEKQDTYNDGVPPGAHVAYDPLELPSELEVLNELTNNKIATVGLSVLKHFQSLELVYFNEAEQLIKRREYEKAVEKYTDAIFDEKLKRISSPITTKSKEMIQKLIENM